MRSVRTLIAALLTIAGVVAVGATTDAANAASSKNLTAEHTHVMKHEEFGVFGRLATHVSRPVEVQFKSGKKWKLFDSTDTQPDGSFSLLVATSSSRAFRYYAPKVTGSFAAITGNPLAITVVPQKVVSTTIVHANQCTPYASSIPDAVTIVVQFSPARSGRSVSLLTSTNGTLTDYEDSTGRVAFTFNPGHPAGHYTALATADDSLGEATESSLPLKYSVEPCVFN